MVHLNHIIFIIKKNLLKKKQKKKNEEDSTDDKIIIKEQDYETKFTLLDNLDDKSFVIRQGILLFRICFWYIYLIHYILSIIQPLLNNKAKLFLSLLFINCYYIVKNKVL